MSQTNAKKRGLQKCNKIFISWSGTNSKEFAKGLKFILEKSVFENTDLECFVSDQDIASGSDWWEKTKKELRTCKPAPHAKPSKTLFKIRHTLMRSSSKI